MKKLLFLFLIMFLTGLTDCEKCMTCREVTTGTGITPITTTFEACGKDIKDVDGKVITSTSGGITVTSKTNCY